VVKKQQHGAWVMIRYDALHTLAAEKEKKKAPWDGPW
jgi:hypothetical protein